MNTKTFIVLVAVFAIASAGTLSSGKKAHAKKELNSEAHYQALKETAFGKNLFNMMSLKFKTSGQLDTILELLDELNTNINQQQAEDNANFETKSAEYTETINENTAIVNEATANIDEANAEIDADKLTISQATEAKDGFLAQIEGINELLTSLAEIREREHNDFLQRTSDQEAILAGLNEVINLFSAELENDPNLDHDAAEAVLDLLNEIRISVEASLSEDAQKENQAQIDYNNFVEEEEAELEDLTNKVNELLQVIEDCQARIATNQAIVDSETIRRSNSQQIVNDTEAALEELTATHNANTQTRDGQITLIGQVKARLRDNEENVQGFLNNA